MTKCNACGAELRVSRERDMYFCEFCGARHEQRTDRHEKYTYHQVDDARIREADVQEVIRLKELEVELARMENERKDQQFHQWMRLLAVTLYFVVMGIFIFLEASSKLGSIWILFYVPLGFSVLRYALRKKEKK